MCWFFFFFFQAEDGIRDGRVTGVQTCALPICADESSVIHTRMIRLHRQYFPELVQRMPLLTERLVGLMSDRIREVTRSEERRVGKECRSRWSRDHEKKKKQK